ncbi:MAG TPA: sigma factor, partial [Ignavibacteria bacterium]|nr:sigma factor [Ignavibacteria bacterium]
MAPSKEGINTKKLTDEELIFNFQEGDITAYNEIVARYKDRLTNYIYRYVGSYDECDDIVQDTFVKVYT